PRARAETPGAGPRDRRGGTRGGPVPVPAPASGSATTVPASAAGTTEKAPARTTSKPAAKTKPASKAASKPAAKPAPKTRAKSTAGATAPAKSAPKSTPKPTAKAEAKSATSPAPSSATDTTPAGRITLRELISRQLAAHGEPRSAAEVGATLREEHPDRELKGNVVRTTLEALVAKGLVQRSRQQKSVYYTHTTAAGTTTRD
uniref:BlaI/MecI/CopY family transcriptional regulator n=1 Tax=Streptomyces sp. SA3_actF TaxID=682181 RepID=UPI0002000A22